MMDSAPIVKARITPARESMRMPVASEANLLQATMFSKQRQIGSEGQPGPAHEQSLVAALQTHR